MRTLSLAIVAAMAMSIPLASAVRAEDTTVIKKSQPSDSSTTVIKKHEGVQVLPVPHPENHTTVIKKEHNDE